MQNNRWLQALIVLLVIIASAWLTGQVWTFLIQFSNIILLFFLSWLLAFVLRPVARWLTERGLPHLVSVMVIYLLFGLVLTVGGFLLIPVITQQTQQLIEGLQTGTFMNQIGGIVAEGEKTLRAWGVKEVDLNRFYSELASQAQSVALGVLNNTFSVLQSVATLMLQVILVFILSFYFMKDGERLFGTILHLLPPRWQDEARLMAISVEKSFGGFLRGQMVFALVYAVLTAIVMMMPPFQLQYVLVASIVAGLCMIIPLIGNFLAFIPPVLACLVTPDKSSQWLWLLLAMFIMQSLMMNILGPRIMSSAIGIHPLYVVAAMLVGGQVAGFWGALFGIPIAGSMNLIGRPLMRRIRHQTLLYRDTNPRALPTSAFLTGPLSVTLAQVSESQAETDEADAVPSTPPPHTAVPSPPPTGADLLDEDLLVNRPVPLTGKAWKLLVYVGSRAVGWAWTRTHARVSRH